MSLFFGLTVTWGVALVAACGRNSSTEPAPNFDDEAQSTGLNFQHYNGMSGERYIVEMMGPGVGLIDFDKDGDLDLFFTQGQPLDTHDQASLPPLGTQLFRNNLNPSTGQMTWTNVTQSSNIESSAYGMGVAVGDYDNDGWDDLFVANLGENELWRNNTDGTFSRQIVNTQVSSPQWSTSATFLDFDADGWLDLMVVNYVNFSVDQHRQCYNAMGAPEYCGPRSFTPQSDRLYRNRGDGTFTDVTQSAGLGSKGPGLGVFAADFDADGWTDIYIANDQSHNSLWINQDGRSFEDEALVRGTAVNAAGMAEASMGVDVTDFDRDGDWDLFMTHLLNETNTFYLNDGSGQFRDISLTSGAGSPSIGLTGFGVAFFDYDTDGWQDLIIANGAVRTLASQRDAGLALPLAQSNQLLRNHQGRFEDVSHLVPDIQKQGVSRSIARGDLDNDGDIDLIVTNNNARAQLLLNNTRPLQRWVGLQLSTAQGRSAIGALVRAVHDNGEVSHHLVNTGGSYLASNDARIVIATTGSAVDAWVTWLDGSENRWSDLAADRYHTLQQHGQTP